MLSVHRPLLLATHSIDPLYLRAAHTHNISYPDTCILIAPSIPQVNTYHNDVEIISNPSSSILATNQDSLLKTSYHTITNQAPTLR